MTRHRVHRRWRLGAAGLVAAAVVAGTAVAGVAALQTPQPVVTAHGRQVEPSATAGAAYIAYAQSRTGHPNVYDVFVKPQGMPRFKANGGGTAYHPGIDTSTMVYQSVRHGQSDLRLIDLSTHVRSVPDGVNTARWEWWPTISGDWILFGRRRFGRARPGNDKIILHNTNTSETRMLDDQSGGTRVQVSPGQVNGDWATWWRSSHGGRRSNVHVYQISSSSESTLPAVKGKLQYASSVASTGTVFYARSDPGCGRHVVIRENSSGIDTPLAKLPKGYDIETTFAVDEGGGSYTVYFDRLNCRSGGSHIYKVVVD